MNNNITTMSKNTLAKRKSYAFKKHVYLLGEDKNGIKYWLESPTWDCGWYWGFGYVETYTNNNNPEKSKDISSHEHIDGSFIGKHEYYDVDIKGFKLGEYIHNIYDSPRLTRTTFDEKTGSILSELFQEFYTLKKTAELFHSAGAQVTTSPIADLLKKEDYEKHINEVLIPAITNNIIELLTP